MDKDKLIHFTEQVDSEIRKIFVELKSVNHRLARITNYLNSMKDEINEEKSKDSPEY